MLDNADMDQNLNNIQDQINAKMHWGDSEQEIEEWLREKHSIEGDRADEMIQKGIQDRKSEIRKACLTRMLVTLVFAIPLAFISMYCLQQEGRMFSYGVTLGVACFGCFTYVFKNLLSYVSGRSDVSIDA